MKKLLSGIIKALFEVIFPRKCSGCLKEVIPNDEIFCITCWSRLPYANNLTKENNDFEKHFYGRVLIEAGGSLLEFTKGGIVQQALHQLKYNNQCYIGVGLGRLMGREINRSGRFNTIDMIVPIPINYKKKLKRGYNQVEMIGQGIAQVLNIPMYSQAVIRKTYHGSQTRKNRLNRIKNVRDGFSIRDEKPLRNKHILLIDDVLTSGATLDFCAQEINKIPGVKISMATVAMGASI